MTKPTAAANATGLRKQIEDDPRNQRFYAEIGKGACEMADSFAPLQDIAVAVELISEAILGPTRVGEPLAARDASALLYIVYELSARADALHDNWKRIDALARAKSSP